VHLGGADHVEGGGAGPLGGLVGDVVVEGGVQFGADLLLALVPAGGGVPDARRGCPQHVGVRELAHVVVGDVGDQVFGVTEIRRMSFDSASAVVGRELEVQSGRD
jgi:hypothetical protein